MKIWFNKVNESRRSMVDLDATEVCVGRDAGNDVVLRSPLVSRRHAVIRRVNGDEQLEQAVTNRSLYVDVAVNHDVAVLPERRPGGLVVLTQRVVWCERSQPLQGSSKRIIRVA